MKRLLVTLLLVHVCLAGCAAESGVDAQALIREVRENYKAMDTYAGQVESVTTV